MITRAWLCDIDGTLAIKGERGPFDWDRVGEDTPNKPVVRVVQAMRRAGHSFLFISGRMEQCRGATIDWLQRFVTLEPLYPGDLLMRADGDFRPDDVVKKEMYDSLWGYDVEGVFDDRARVVAMWRSLGLTVFDVAGWDG
jgi:hypothetical protein